MRINEENLEVGEESYLFPRDTRGEAMNNGEDVHLLPGDRLVVSIKEELSKLAGGGVSVESTVIRLSYNDVMALLKRARREHRTRKSRTPGTKFSRSINLMTRAIESGKWSTGAEIDREEMGRKLVEALSTFQQSGGGCLTDKAKASLLQLQSRPDLFLPITFSAFRDLAARYTQ